MDGIIAVGFGSANVLKDGECVYDEQDAMHAGREFWTGQDAENAAPGASWGSVAVVAAARGGGIAGRDRALTL